MSRKPTSRQSETNWTRIDSTGDEDIDLTDDPELAPELFANAILRKGLQPVARKKQVTLRIDEDVLNWFRSSGKGYQTRINQLLREYMKAHETHHG